MKTETKTEYDIQAEKFVESTGIKIVKTYTGHRKYFDDDKERRSCWHITVTRGDNAFSYDFGQSIVDSYAAINREGQRMINKSNSYARCIAGHLPHGIKEIKRQPSDYSLLACMSMDSYQSDTFEDWCGEFGYDTDSRKALDTFLKCQKISSDINRFFTDAELEQLQDIQ